MEVIAYNTHITPTYTNAQHRMEKILTNSFLNILDTVMIATFRMDTIQLNIVSSLNRSGPLAERYKRSPYSNIFSRVHNYQKTDQRCHQKTDSHLPSPSR